MKIIAFIFNFTAFALPLLFFPKTSELFEFSKIILLYSSAILMSAAWVGLMILNKKLIFTRTRLDAPLLLLLLAHLVSTIFSIDPWVSVFGYYSRFHGGLLSVASFAVLYWAFVTFMNKALVKKFITTLVLSSAVAAVYAFIEHFGISPSCVIITGSLDTACWAQSVSERVFGTFGQPNWLAAWLVAIIPLVWAKTLMRGHNNIVYLILSALLFTTLLFTKSRSGSLAFFASFVVFWPVVFYLYRKNVKKVFSVFFLTTCYVLLSSFFIWNPFMPGTSPTPGVTESGDIRQIVWQGALELWKQYPVFGTGVETFGYAYYKTRPVAHNLTSEWNFVYNKAHNEYLNFLATTGTAGFAAYTILIIAALFQIWSAKDKLIKAGLLSGYATILITNFFGFATSTTNFLFFLFPAIAFSLTQKGRRLPARFALAGFRQKVLLAAVLLTACLGLSAAARYFLADYYYARGLAGSTSFLVQAHELMPYEPVYRAELAGRYAQMAAAGHSEGLTGESGLLLTHAKQEAAFIEKNHPRAVKLLKQVAHAYGDMADVDKQFLADEQRVLVRLAKLAPTDPTVRLQLAISLTKAGETGNAIEAAQAAIMLKPDYEQAIMLLDALLAIAPEAE